MTKMKIYELCHENEVTVPICMYKSVFSTYFGDYTVPECSWCLQFGSYLHVSCHEMLVFTGNTQNALLLSEIFGTTHIRWSCCITLHAYDWCACSMSKISPICRVEHKLSSIFLFGSTCLISAITNQRKNGFWISMHVTQTQVSALK